MKTFIYPLIVALAVSGCATTWTSQVTSKLSIGMTKEDVLRKCGRPYTTGAALDQATGLSKEYLVYKETIYPGDYFRPYEALTTHVFIVAGRVVQFGPADRLAQQRADPFVKLGNNPEIFFARK